MAGDEVSRAKHQRVESADLYRVCAYSAIPAAYAAYSRYMNIRIGQEKFLE